MRRSLPLFAAALLMMAAPAPAVAQDTEDTEASAIKPGPWRFVAETATGPLPFLMDITQDGDAWSATFVNGSERVDAEQVTVNNSSLVIAMPSYETEIALTAETPDTLSGTIRLTSYTGPVVVPVTGEQGATHRFVENPDLPSVDLTGRWSVTTLGPEDGAEPNSGLGDITQDGTAVEGFWAFNNFDSRTLSGALSGKTLALSYFDGGFGAWWRGEVQPDGTLKGETAGMTRDAPATWTAKRDENAALKDASKLTYLKPGYDRFAFTFPDVNGEPVSLSDDRFQDKVVIVTIGGSWCPTCHDEAMFLEPWLEENRGRGVAAVGLYYEYYEDFDRASAAIKRFVARYGIDYPMLVAGVADKEAASRTLPMINEVLVYPTMIIVDRQGAVRHIHTGFPGQATGALHEQFKAEFNTIMDELLAEQG